jgi:hypothetical protein
MIICRQYVGYIYQSMAAWRIANSLAWLWLGAGICGVASGGAASWRRPFGLYVAAV